MKDYPLYISIKGNPKSYLNQSRLGIFFNIWKACFFLTYSFFFYPVVFSFYMSYPKIDIICLPLLPLTLQIFLGDVTKLTNEKVVNNWKIF